MNFKMRYLFNLQEIKMIQDQFWKPDKLTRSAISRGDKRYRKYLKRKRVEYELALIEWLDGKLREAS